MHSVKHLDKPLSPCSVFSLIILISNLMSARCNGSVDATIEIDCVTPDPVFAGRQVRFDYTVINTGDEDHAFGVGCEIERDGVAVAPVGTKLIDVVYSGFFYMGAFQFRIPADWEEDEYTVYMVVWSGPAGHTGSEWLDCASKNFAIKRHVIAAEISSGDVEKSSYSPGESSRLKVTVKNTGTVILTGLWLNADVANPSGTLVQQGKWLDVGTLNPGQSKAVPASGYSDLWTVGAGSPAGTYTVAVGLRDESQPYDMAAGLDTFDVTRTAQAQIVSGDVEKSSYNPEENTRLKVTVKNTGTIKLTGLWLNADVANPSDTLVRRGKWLDVGTLNPGQSRTIPSSGYSGLWTVDAGSPAGTYTVAVGLRDADRFYDMAAALDTFEVKADPRRTSRKWTVLVYMNHDDSGFKDELTQISHYSTINDMEKVLYREESLQAVVLVDFVGDTGTFLVPVAFDLNPVLVTSPQINVGEKDMGDPATLTWFIKEASDQYPAKRYALMLSGHGGGIEGYGATENMSAFEIEEAIENSGIGIDLISFDACLMGSGIVLMSSRQVKPTA